MLLPKSLPAIIMLLFELIMAIISSIQLSVISYFKWRDAMTELGSFVYMPFKIIQESIQRVENDISGLQYCVRHQVL